MPDTRERLLRAIMACVLLPAIACGGSTKPADEPESSTGSAASRRSDDAEGGDVEGDTDAEPAAASPSACSDETCFTCGEGLCLQGMYCDLGAGPGCSWLPECAKSASCACITRVLGSGCKCDDSGGGPQVDCAGS